MGLVENVHPFVLFTILTACSLSLTLYEDDSKERYEAVRTMVGAHGKIYKTMPRMCN